jgi:hypothetical protein
MIRKIARDRLARQALANLADIKEGVQAIPSRGKSLVIQPMPEREKRTLGRPAEPEINVLEELAKVGKYVPPEPPKERCIVCQEPVYFYETLEPEPICLWCEKQKESGTIAEVEKWIVG